jgi:DNA-binding NtrC family response regulator
VRVLIADDDTDRAAALAVLCQGVTVEKVTGRGLAGLPLAPDVVLAIVAPSQPGQTEALRALALARRTLPNAIIAMVFEAAYSVPADVATLPPYIDDSIAPFINELIGIATAKALPGTTIIGGTPAIESLLRRLPMLAQTDATVLITGESGTGKEVFARRVHELSLRRERRFVAVNCGAIADTLLESELFGYKRGAFTDAAKDTIGLVTEAEGGTLFLDEIGEVSHAVQVKLLRFLQSKEYKPLGSPKTERADVRIVAATNRDLKQQVALGAFREDLFYRLNIVPLAVPPLRDRRADIVPLAQHFLRVFAREHRRRATSFSPEVLARLSAYDWPGNVRELENRVQQLVVMSDSAIIKGDGVEQALPPSVGGAFKLEKQRVIEEFERAYVARLLNDTRGNISEAARIAGLDRKSFWQLARRHGAQGQGRARVPPSPVAQGDHD